MELNLSPDELKNSIPEEKLKALKGKGILQAYTLAHEGVSQPKVLGAGKQVLKWPRAVIRTIAEKIKEGTKFFLGHGETNDHTGRESVGEIVSSFVKEIGGRLSHIIVGHFPNAEKVQDMDVCSMEADVYTDPENIVGDVNEISGIALGSSDKENPAFPGALRLGTVQCFGETKKKENEIMNFEEARQLFSLDDIKNDREFGKLFTDNETLKTENEKLTKEKKEIGDKSAEAIRSLDVSNANKKLETFLVDLTDKQKSFITKRFNPENVENLTDEGLKEFVENTKKEFAETAKLFGASELGDTPGNKGDNGDKDSSGTMEEQALKELEVT